MVGSKSPGDYRVTVAGVLGRFSNYINPASPTPVVSVIKVNDPESWSTDKWTGEDLKLTKEQCRRWLTSKGVPDPLPRFLPVLTKSKGGVVAQSALQLVDATVLGEEAWATFDEPPSMYQGYLSVNDGTPFLGAISCLEFDWEELEGLL